MWITDGAWGLLLSLTSQGGLIVVFAVILFRVQLFRDIILKSRKTVPNYLLLILYFSGMGVLGTYTGIPVQGALANSRIVGVFVGGLIGGPVVGIASALLAGVHRWAIDIGGFTSLACMISTIVEGCLAALLHPYFIRSKNKWSFGLVGGALAEMLQMVIILLVAKPYGAAVELVRLIGIPMIVGNAVGIGMFVAISENLFREEERIAARQSQKILEIAGMTLPLFRKGYTEEQANKTARIIAKELSMAAVAFTDREKILAHVGIGEDHHRPGMPIQTEMTRSVLQLSCVQVARSKQDIHCSQADCPLLSAVIVPLMRADVPIGTLKLYREREYAISEVDIEVAKGLAGLLSLQIELSELDTREQLLSKARLRALQSQINPHFLFNAMNTISSLISEDHEKAKDLLLNLSDYYRSRLQLAKEFIPLQSEIENINAYIAIEQARFGSKISVCYDLDGDTSFLIPPLILQPLVENAVKHGLQKSIHPGCVKITVRFVQDEACICIEDDGVGIDEATLSNIFDESHGLDNVHQRLINLYGAEYGLHIESEVGKGTKVWLKIPCNTVS
ncbi:MAG: sensor histidine kinase [Spirochaetia bacterium]|nr:sensor histidine kinase [Spirochaetia bacterium]